jgi:hypothetical protein
LHGASAGTSPGLAIARAERDLKSLVDCARARCAQSRFKRIAINNSRMNALSSLLGHHAFLKDLRRAGQRHQHRTVAGQLFAPPDGEIPAWEKPTHEPNRNLLLQRRRKIGEGDIAAEDEIEALFWGFRPQILM